MEIFVVENNVVKPTKEILLVFPFSAIWERDNSPNKAIALKEFAFIEFMTSPKASNIFLGYDESIRPQKIIEGIFNNIDYQWSPDRLIEEAIMLYKEWYYKASPTLSYYEANINAANKVKDFFNTFDLNERNLKTNAPIFTAKSITDAIGNADTVLKKLISMKESVEQEIYQAGKTKANRVINQFER